MTNMTFNDLRLSDEMLATLMKAHWHNPTAIQAKALSSLPLVEDTLLEAPQQSGKTTAILLCLIATLRSQKKKNAEKNKAILFVPDASIGKEIAAQITQIANDIQIGTSLPHQRIQSIQASLQAGFDLWISTPKRFLELEEQLSPALEQVCLYGVLKFPRQLRGDGANLLARIHQKKAAHIYTLYAQTQATETSQRFIQQHCPNLQIISHSNPDNAVEEPEKEEPKIKVEIRDVFTERFIVVPTSQMTPQLKRILPQVPRCVIFASNRARAMHIYHELKTEISRIQVMHSETPLEMRTRIMNRYKAGQLPYLITTDLTPYDFSVAGMPLVINYDLPRDVESYVLRVGRTSEAARCQSVITLVHPSLTEFLPRFSHFLQIEITPENPFAVDIRTKADFDRQLTDAIRQRRATMRRNNMRSTTQSQEASVTQERDPTTTEKTETPKKQYRRFESSSEKKGPVKERKKKNFTPRKERQERSWDDDDDNFGNSIHYQPRHGAVHSATSHPSINWNPADPYNPTSQALSLPQVMPDEMPRMRKPGRPFKKKFNHKNGNQR